MPDEAPAGLEQSLLETRQRPVLDGDGQKGRSLGRVSRSSIASSSTALAGRRMAYATSRRCSDSYRAGRAKAASAQ